MKKHYVIAVLTLTCVLGFGLKAHGQNAEVIVTVPFEFVAGGQTLPAGKYTVVRNTPDAHSGITLRGTNNIAVMLPVAVDGTSVVDQPKLDFERIGGENFLSKIEAREGVYSFAVPRAMALVAKRKDHSTGSSSGGN
jgi:hypothetical protein